MTPNEIETLRLLVTELVPWILIAAAVLLGPWLVWAWRQRLLRRVSVSGDESKIDRTRRVIAELEPLINRYGAFLEANAHLIYGIPASRLETTLETTPEELKAALLRYGSALRDCNLLDEQTRQILRNGYCELGRVLPEVEGNNDKDSIHLDRIAAETIRLIQEFDSQFPSV
jgi:hypothetical protein